MRKSLQVWIPILLVAFATVAASAQSFRVQCPTSTITHPLTGTNCGTNPTGPRCNNTEPLYNGPTQFNPPTVGVPSGTQGDFVTPMAGTVNGAIKCQQISGGDGFMTEADGNQTFMFSFGPLSGLADVAAGHPSTQFPYIFNTPYPGTLTRGDPATTDGATSGASPGVGLPPLAPFTWNGAVGLAPDIPNIVTVTDIIAGPLTSPLAAPNCAAPSANTVTVFTDSPLGVKVNDQIVIANDAHSSGIGGTPTAAGFLNAK